MSRAYGLLGILFLVLLVGAYFAVRPAEAPSSESDISSDVHLETVEDMSLTLTSPAFGNNESIPTKYTCDGEGVSPELHIENVPEGTESLVLLMDDPDIPQVIKESRGIEAFNHWVVYNIPAGTSIIEEGVSIGTEGLNSRAETGYVGSCPPPEYEPTKHRYIFRLYALSGTLNFIKAPTLEEVETSAQGMSIESTELIGTYDRAN